MKFCIIDVSNLVHRAKHGVMKSSSVGNQPIYLGPTDDDDPDPAEERKFLKQGLILDAVFKSLRKAFDKFDSDHAVVCFDGRSWRKDFYPEYKKRPSKAKTPKELEDEDMIHEIIDSLMEFCQGYTNVTVLHSQGVEADDFIARWVQLHDEPAFEHVIVSRDSDFRQLVREGVELFAPAENVLYTVDGVYYQDGKKRKKDALTVEKYGETWTVKTDSDGNPVVYDPEWELFFKCIRGDASDNIKSAFPKVRESKMREAFYGDVKAWNNFINETWGPDDNRQCVKQRYEFNRTLIDLTAQPEDVIELMDELIGEQIDKKPKRMIGAYFAKFCIKYGLDNMQSQAGYFTDILSKRYPLAADAD